MGVTRGSCVRNEFKFLKHINSTEIWGTITISVTIFDMHAKFKELQNNTAYPCPEYLRGCLHNQEALEWRKPPKMQSLGSRKV